MTLREKKIKYIHYYNQNHLSFCPVLLVCLPLQSECLLSFKEQKDKTTIAYRQLHSSDGDEDNFQNSKLNFFFLLQLNTHLTSVALNNSIIQLNQFPSSQEVKDYIFQNGTLYCIEQLTSVSQYTRGLTKCNPPLPVGGKCLHN